MERLNGYETWAERDFLETLSTTELKEMVADANIDILENPWRAYYTSITIGTAIQILIQRKSYERIYE